MARTSGFLPERVHSVLEMVGLSSAANKKLGEFSLGMSQRLGVAGALLGDRLVLLTIFFPAMFGGMMPSPLQENVLACMLGNAVDSLVMGHHNPDYAQYRAKPRAAVVTIAG